MKTILGIDIGYSSVKVTLGTSDGAIQQLFKFPSCIGITERSEFIQDKRIYEYKDHAYYVGQSALRLPSECLVDITEYKNLEYYAGLFLFHALEQLNGVPDVIVSGLSKAQIENSGHFKEQLMQFTVNGKDYKFDEVYVLPQGAGSKLCIDKYGDNFPVEQKQFTDNVTYVGCDIGFNTLDMFLVTEGKTSPNLFEGIEREGIMKVAELIQKKIKELHGRDVQLQEAREVLDTKVYKLRGVKYPFDDFIKEVKTGYLKSLLALVEAKYGKIIDKCDFIALSGGGSAMFNSTEDGFIKVPKTKHEYQNAIGQFLFGLTR